MYQVIVGNIGTVITTDNKTDAEAAFNEYKAQSESNVGRAGGEPVTLFQDDEIVKEHYGTLDNE
jgi:hypothetical protein